MNTLTFVRDKEWIDQAKAYTYEALRFLGIRYKWNSKEHIQIDDDHVIKFIIKKDFSPTIYENEKGKFIRQMGYVIKFPKGIREDNNDIHIFDLQNILSQFLELKVYPDMMGMTKLQYRDHRKRKLNESKKIIKEAESVIKNNEHLIRLHRSELNRCFMKDREVVALDRKVDV